MARSDGLIETEIADDLVVYDTSVDRVHCLNTSAAALWRACDGTRSLKDLAAFLQVDDAEVIWQGLRQLDEQDLLIGRLPSPRPENLSRREALRKIAIGGAIGFAVPTVISIAAPEAASAASCRRLGQSCQGAILSQGTCCPGLLCAATLLCI